ncbi:thiopeptide-type bacteriocin biosynthesis protein [Salinactinospora qingdaonensis]|uniref:Thiopeptide-type bacteriocin biosynthesis domain-containing protein n=1 Tax=Salinactinospora qingdaonensis TaxID=702744 RepID=A0ABP7GES4_9ACTN
MSHPLGEWPQALITFPNREIAESVAARSLLPALDQEQSEGRIEQWFLTRKSPQWRLRYHGPGADRRLLGALLDDLTSRGAITAWVEGTYEPETMAFGGPAAMRIAHALFHTDSRHILHYLTEAGAGSTSDRRLGRRELALLLTTALMRAANQDIYEQADVWKRVADHRPVPTATMATALHNASGTVHRLLTVDTGSSTELATAGALRPHAPWLRAFEEAGYALGALVNTGEIERGLRGVLAHHVLFHFNRIGLPTSTQGGLAHTAATVVFGPPPSSTSVS